MLPWPSLEAYQQASAVAVENVLHDGKAKAGPPARPAFLHADAVEALGEARNVFCGDAAALVDTPIV